MVSFPKVSLSLFILASNVGRVSSASMPPRMLKTSSLTEEEHYIASRNTHEELLTLLPDKKRFLQSNAAIENSSVHVQMTQEDKAYIREYKKTEKLFPMPTITGAVKTIQKAVGKGNNSQRRLGQKHNFDSGIYEERSDGFTWTLNVKSYYALGLSVFIKNIVVPDDIVISFFNADGDFDTNIETRISNKEVWTKTVNGNEAFLVFTYKGLDIEEALSSLSFSVSQVSIFNPDPSDEMETRKLGSCNWGIADCVVDYMCCKKNTRNSDPDGIAPQECGNWQNANEDSALFRDEHITNYSRAIAKMSWTDANWRYSCTGGLINNADGRPLLLTANHCISKSNASMELYFGARNNKCEANDTCVYSFKTADTIGATKLASSRASDFTLMEISQALPEGKNFYALGWNTDKVQPGTKTYRISHPRAGPRSYQEQVVSNNQPEVGFIYSQPLLGETMSGSSGGPIVNSNNEIVEQLYGDSNDNADWCVTQSDGTNKYGNYKNIDGEFLTTYNTGKVAEILGTICTEGDICDDGDACTENDVCSGGVCSGTPIECIDGTCENGVCVEVCIDGTMCDDSDGCTVNDVCFAGVCAGTPKQCNEFEVCENGNCVPQNTCSGKKKTDCSEVFEELTSTDYFTYGTVLKTCENLMSFVDAATIPFIRRVFQKCCEDGHVSSSACFELRQVAPVDLYRELILEDEMD